MWLYYTFKTVTHVDFRFKFALEICYDPTEVQILCRYVRVTYNASLKQI